MPSFMNRLERAASPTLCGFASICEWSSRVLPWYRYGWVVPVVLALVTVSCSAQVNVVTRGYDLNRTGANLNETILTPGNVNPASFGKLYTVPIDAHVYAQPLYMSALNIAGAVHDVVFVASMRNTIYAIDAPTGAVLWQRRYDSSVNPKHVQNNHNIAWNTGIGIVGTPVIDSSTNIMYFVSKYEQIVGSNDPNNNIYGFHLNAIDVTSGAPVLGSPVAIAATYTTPDLITPLVFSARRQNQRCGLALSQGNIYIAFGSHDDIQPYHGWVMAYSATNLAQTAVYATTTLGVEGGIWNAGSAPAIDAAGNLYLSTGNGSFGPTTNGLVQTGNSFIKLSPSLQLLDYFTPHNSANLNAGDQDLGSSGLLLLPETNYVLGGGKQGVLYLADTADLGQFNSGSNKVRQEFQAIYGKGTSHIHGTPTYFENQNGPTTYVWGENDVLRAFLYNVSTGLLSAKPYAMGAATAPVTNNDAAMPGGFTSISANGTSNGIVWASTPYNANAASASVPGVLYAYDAATLSVLWSDKMVDARDEVGRFAKFIPPVVANGRMFVPTFGSSTKVPDGTGQLVAYGLLPVLTVNVSSAAMTAGAAVPVLTGSVLGLRPSDQLGGTIVVAYSTSATSDSPAGTYAITAAVSGSSSQNYKVVVNTGTLTVTADAAAPVIDNPSGFAGSNNLQLNGSAALSGSRLRLVNSTLRSSASAFFTTQVNVQRFVSDFTFQLSNPGADGIAFVLQASGTTALGGSGSALGVGPAAGKTIGIAKSVALKFDLYDNNGEGPNSTGIFLNGVQPRVPSIDLSGSGIDLHSGHPISARLVYDGVTLQVQLTDTVTNGAAAQSYTVDIPAVMQGTTAYAGFTAGTGTQSETGDILTWDYTPTAAPARFIYPSGSLPEATSGPALRPLTWTGFPDGTGTVLDSLKIGDNVTFTLQVPVAGTYDIAVSSKEFNDRGVFQLAVDGSPTGSATDEYDNSNPNGVYKVFDLGTANLSAGTHTFVFSVAGKNPSSVGSRLSFGQLTLTAQ